jgi:hypothetical protein
MGSSTSKPRRGHEKPTHLAKVGSPQSDAWAHETRLRRVFGPTWLRTVIAIIAIAAILGLIILTI